MARDRRGCSAWVFSGMLAESSNGVEFRVGAVSVTLVAEVVSVSLIGRGGGGSSIAAPPAARGWLLALALGDVGVLATNDTVFRNACGRIGWGRRNQTYFSTGAAKKGTSVGKTNPCAPNKQTTRSRIWCNRSIKTAVAAFQCNEF